MDLQTAVNNAIHNAIENGYGQFITETEDVDLAFDLLDCDADVARLAASEDDENEGETVENVVAAIETYRATHC